MNRHALIFTLLIAAASAGCSTSPAERFFTLASDPAPQLSTGSISNAVSIVVGPVSVPELVDRPQFVVRTSANRVEIAEQSRWAAPLKHEIPRVIADHLGRFIEGARTTTSSSRAVTAPDYRVTIDIKRFDSTPGESATIEAAWAVKGRDATTLEGRSLVREISGAGYDELVQAHSRALTIVSRDIADSIKGSRSKSAASPRL
jgi:uncharacterized protein